jgi:hypothetical protein
MTKVLREKGVNLRSGQNVPRLLTVDLCEITPVSAEIGWETGAASNPFARSNHNPPQRFQHGRGLWWLGISLVSTVSSSLASISFQEKDGPAPKGQWRPATGVAASAAR